MAFALQVVLLLVEVFVAVVVWRMSWTETAFLIAQALCAGHEEEFSWVDGVLVLVWSLLLAVWTIIKGFLWMGSQV